MTSKSSRSWNALALGALCLALLTACSTPRSVVKTEIVKQYPPAAWVQNCPMPAYIAGQDWAYVAEYAKALQLALDQCNCDKAKLRAWSADAAPPACEVKP